MSSNNELWYSTKIQFFHQLNISTWLFRVTNLAPASFGFNCLQFLGTRVGQQALASGDDIGWTGRRGNNGTSRTTLLWFVWIKIRASIIGGYNLTE